MIELKPRCAGCGTGNAIDAIFCQECGCGLNIENNNGDIGLEEAKEQLKIINKAINVDPNSKSFDYSLDTKKKNSLDHLRESLSSKTPTPFPEDKRLDFRSRQIPDWEFGKANQVKETFKEEFEKWSKDPHYIPKSTQAIITQIEQAQTWPDKIVAKPDIATRRGPKPNKEFKWGVSGENASSGLDRPFPVRHIRKLWGGGKCDCDGITSICDEFRAKQEERPYSAIIGTDVRKGITPIRKKPKLTPVKDDEMKKSLFPWGSGKDSTMKISNSFSKLEKLVLTFSTLAIIISLGILNFM